MSGIDARFRLARARFELNVAFTAPGRGVSAIFGPSGSGKTTLLRCIAGLERAPGGYLSINDEIWQDEANRRFLPPHQRSLGYVFQDARLFPHLTVRGNLAYAQSRVPASTRRVALDETVALLGIERLLDRRPERLSGGERQRVAIARALVASPALLILDEPMASLDTPAKAEILPYLERLHNALAIPVLFVSHVLDEVLRLADHLLLIKDGALIASGPLDDMLTRPDLPLLQSDEAGVAITATVRAHEPEYHLTHLAFDGVADITTVRTDLPIGTPVRVRILARDVSLALERPVATSIQNIFPAHVVELAPYSAAQLTVKLDVGGAPLLARITKKSAAQLNLAPGKAVFAQVKSVALMP